jgi:hypothetical protein
MIREIERLIICNFLRREKLHLARYIDDEWNEDYFPFVFGGNIWTDGTWIP